MPHGALRATQLQVATEGERRVVFLQALRRWAGLIKRDALTLWMARRHPDTPWYAKALLAFAVAYALSPIDLIPDFIPVLGYLDDVILLPVLIWLALRLLPAHVLAASREQAQAWLASQPAARPRSVAGAVGVVLVWLGIGVALAWWLGLWPR